ncbi:MAG: SlyX family protein [Boseongicola sp.]|nr:SlyX family protein [Boseongicola sp.]MDD9978599.1 SlyX family protein [Boseongicola sp.]
MSIALEERLAYLEKLCDELNSVVTRQSGEIDVLTRRIALLMEREALREAEGTGGVIVGDEKPPHY